MPETPDWAVERVGSDGVSGLWWREFCIEREEEGDEDVYASW